MKIKRKLFGTFLLLQLLFCPLLFSQQSSDGPEEVYLTFRYQSLVNVFITAYYSDGEFYLPHTELFRVLELEAEPDLGAASVSGILPEIGSYEVNYRTGQAQTGRSEIVLSADDYLVRELDYYLRSSLFYELFGLDFRVNLNSLMLDLESEYTLPITARTERERRRRRILQRDVRISREYYPLEFDRNRQVFNAGFLDYNVSANLSSERNSYQFSTALGSELLGGDLQGTLFGNWSRESSSLQSRSLRWQYGFHDSSLLTKITVGQTSSSGLAPAAYTGVRFTNEPIEPRYLYDDFTYSGQTHPDSEVEIYRNNALVDFQQTDSDGNYNFQLPLTYGSTQYSMRVYSPTGEIVEQTSRIQIPYSFIPPNELNYTVEAGQLDNPLVGTLERSYMTRGNVEYGLNNWISASGGVEYFDSFHSQLPTFTTGISTRFLTNYLLHIEAASEAFYRANANVIYGNGSSVNVGYTKYTDFNSVYNPSSSQSTLQGDLFLSFQWGMFPLFFRTSVYQDFREFNNLTRYRFNVNTRWRRLNVRMGYRDTQSGRLSLSSTRSSRMTASVRYSFPRRGDLPDLLHGVFLRGQLVYSPSVSRIQETEFQISRSLFGEGSLQIAAGRNFIGQYNYARLNLSFNFNNIRTNTSVMKTRNTVNMTQSLRGSVGYDSTNDRFLLSSRQQVGRSGVVVRMFEDYSNSGGYDEGDQLLNESAVRIERAGGRVRNEEGLNYITELHPYRRYNVTINKSAIYNPLLVPMYENFSIVTDPNQFKVIDIPLHMTGVIDGQVLRSRNDRDSGIAGLRLILQQQDGPFRQELKTFSDGTFYAYEIPPGTYTLAIDPDQLAFISGRPDPEQIEFEVEPVSEGDFVTDLNFRIVQEEADSVEMDEPVAQRDGQIPADESPDSTITAVPADELAAITDSIETNERVLLVDLKSIYFDFDSYGLTEEAAQTLMENVEELQQHPDLRLRIVGYTDHLGDSRYNQYLSTKRAEAVAEFYINDGISDDRIEIRGLGNHPDPCTAEEAVDGTPGCQKNREVLSIPIEPEMEDSLSTDELTSDDAIAVDRRDPESRNETGEDVLVIDLESVYFAFDSDSLTEEAAQTLMENVEGLQQNPGLDVRIVGYTDHLGDSRYNQYLSTKRAEAVAEFYINEGISDDRIEIRGLGNHPEPCTAEEARDGTPGCQMNREVQSISVVPDSKD